DLKPEDIVVEENGKSQKIANVELVTPSNEGLSSLPETIYSNRPEVNAPRTGYTILLIDALNTPVQNQAYARRALLEWASLQLQPGHPVAVYALGNSLYRLQGFTDDPELLKAAILQSAQFQLASKDNGPQPTTTRAPVPGSTSAGGPRSANPQFAPLISRLDAFQTEQTMYNADVVIATTTDALRALARMMLGVPGRKNLVWVTAGVPITLRLEDVSTTTVLPTRANNDPTAPPPLQQEESYAAYAQNIRQSNAGNVQEVASLLQQAQVSIYAVDARGLFGGNAQTSAQNSGLNSSGVLVMGNEFGQSVSNANAYITNSQSNMKTIASETGGKYFLNRNDVAEAVNAASRDGGTYYSIAYYPEKKKFDGGFRKIKVVAKRPGLSVRNREGYYAVDFSKKDKKARENELGSMLRYTSLAPSTELLFDAQVKPQPAAAQAKIPVAFLVRPGNFTAEDAKDGKHINLEFFVTAATPAGKVAANTGMLVNTTLPAEQYAQVSKQGIVTSVEVTLPPGTYNLLLAVRDNPTGMVGTLTIPVELAAPPK
ncbi:MAG TPA: VWA domain-containing protein, partial [Terriglobales bacterium]|nr:VWA domain-containing protein [Terriglobales bacterium]